MDTELNQLVTNIGKDTILQFFRRQISSFRTNEEDLSDSKPEQGYEDYSDLLKHGEAELGGGDELLVLSCKYKGELTTRSSKKKQYEIAKRALTDDFKDGAIFIFYDEEGKFRLSYIRRTYGDAETKHTPWRRYTYFVDPTKQNKTFRKRLETADFTSLDGISTVYHY